MSMAGGNRLKGNIGRMLSRTANILGVLLVISAWLSVAYYWDTTRIYVKRLKAENRYVYDEIRPEYLGADPARFLSITDTETAHAARLRLLQVIWGQSTLPVDLLPDSVRRDLLDNRQDTSDCPSLELEYTILRLKCQLGRYEDWGNLAGIDELITNVGPLYKASVAYFRPKRPNGMLVVYQNGYASTYHHQYRHIERLIDKGFTVAASNHVGYGDNYCPPLGGGKVTKDLVGRVSPSPTNTR